MVTDNYFAINKSGQKVVIKDAWKDNQVVGTLYDREAFILLANEGELHVIKFLNSSGNLVEATINENTLPATNFFGFCSQYPYAKEVISDEYGTREYNIYKMRRTMTVYKKDGDKWGSVAAGMYVATNNNTVGETMPYCKMVDYVKSTAGKWVRVTGDGVNYGFVDTGLRSASGYGSIAFYGSW